MKKDNVFEEPYDLDKIVACHMQVYYDEGVVTDSHIHDFVEFIYGVDCEYKVYVDNREFDFKTGNFMVFNSKQVHKIVNVRNGMSKHICVRFNVNMITLGNMFASEMKYKIHFLMKNDNQRCFFGDEQLKNTQIVDAMWNMYRENEKKEYGYEIAVINNLLKIILCLLRLHYNDDSANINTVDEIRILKILAFIDDNYMNQITVEDIARQCFVSSSYFSRWFKKVTGKTFTQYVNMIRIDHAVQLLVNSEFSITEISMMTGFTNTSYFIKQFKRIMGGSSPKQYRGMHK